MSEDRTEYMPCRVLTMPQGTHEWHQARLGRVTSSEVTNVITPTGKPTDSKSRRSYAIQLAWERITKVPKRNVKVYSIERGHELEGQARIWYYLQTKRVVSQVGFCVTLDDRAGCSPDGLVGDDGMIEIKSFEDKHYAEIMLSGEIDGKIIMQMQDQMLVTGRLWNDFVLFTDVRPFTGWIQRVQRDPIMCGKIHAAKLDFMTEVDEIYHSLIEMAGLTPDKLDFPAPIMDDADGFDPNA